MHIQPALDALLTFPARLLSSAVEVGNKTETQRIRINNSNYVTENAEEGFRQVGHFLPYYNFSIFRMPSSSLFSTLSARTHTHTHTQYEDTVFLP